MAEPESKEYFWGCELSKEKPEFEWTFEEEEEDTDFLIHTLFLKHAVLGASAVKGERNLVSIETKAFNDKPISQPFFSLTLGQKDNCYLDLSCSHKTPVIFRLTEGSGPVYLSAQQLVEFPEEPNASQDFTEDEMDDLEDEEEISPKKELIITKKRKAGGQPAGKSKQRGKLDDSADNMSDEDDDEEDEEDEDMEDEDEDEEDEDEEEEEEEESPVKAGKKKPKKGKVESRKVEVKEKKLSKTAKVPPKKAAKKGKAK